MTSAFLCDSTSVFQFAKFSPSGPVYYEGQTFQQLKSSASSRSVRTLSGETLLALCTPAQTKIIISLHFVHWLPCFARSILPQPVMPHAQRPRLLHLWERAIVVTPVPELPEKTILSYQLRRRHMYAALHVSYHCKLEKKATKKYFRAGYLQQNQIF